MPFKTLSALRLATAALIILLRSLTAAASYPPVRNYSSDLHEGGTQTWAIARDSGGRMFFGNKNGLLIFDSRKWYVTGVDNNSTVRALSIDENTGRMYAGASEEFGYFAPDSITGTLTYTNLSDAIKPRHRPFKEIWRILRIEGSQSVWFQSDTHIFCYNGNSVSAFPADDRITASGVVDNRIYIATAHGQILELRGDGFHSALKVPGPRARVCAILSHSKRPMLVTDYDGLYIIENGVAQRFTTDIDGFLKQSQVFCAAQSPDGDYAFGTVTKGVVIKNFRDNTTAYANNATGMQNNTVLSAFFDSEGNLWVGLDNGIDLINVNTPIYTLLGATRSYGAGYMSLRVGNILYLGTNQGLYALDNPDHVSPDPPVLRPLLRGQVWDITTLGNDVAVCSDATVSIGKGLSFNSLGGAHETGGSWAAIELHRHPGYALVSTYDGFHLLKREGASWVNLGPVAGYNDIGGHFVEDRYGSIWIPHWLKGVYRLEIDIEHRRFKSSKFFNTDNGFPSNKNIGVTLIDGSPLFTTENGFYRLAANGTDMVPDKRMNAILGTQFSPRLHMAPNGDIWSVVTSSISVSSRNIDGAPTLDSVTYSPMAGRLIAGFDNFNFISDSRLIVSMQDGFYDVDLSRRILPDAGFGVYFSSMQLKGDTTLTYVPHACKGVIEVPYGLNSILFEAVAPEYRTSQAVLYSFRLDNYDSDWSPWSASNAKEYTRLREGSYTMHVRAVNPYTRTTHEQTLQFSVMPPWFRTSTAKTIYTILSLILLYLCYIAVRTISMRASRKVARRKQLELDTLSHNAKQESLRKDFEIAELKGRQLEQDVKHKTEELSNITMNVVRKNEILLDISNRLENLENAELTSDVRRQVSRIKSIIRDNISHDDDWRTFIHNFDAAYEDYTKKLLALHPTLTPTELRVCCYIKMGLSSKDIAPLFNISYRSVEMTRYRLRKKLNLRRENSLTEYLTSIS